MRRREQPVTTDRHGDVVPVDPPPCKHCGLRHETYQLGPWTVVCSSALQTEGRIAPAVRDDSLLADRSDDDMNLPAGETCGGCANYKRCEWLIGCDPGSTRCDWSPSRFRPRSTP